MTRRRAGGTRLDDPGTGLPSSVPEIGRLLRRARTRQGLRVEDVAGRAGLNVHQCEALESGTVDRIPDRVVVLKTLRRYADSLGLPGDRFVLALVEHWPAAPGMGQGAGLSTVAVPLAGTAEVRQIASSVAVGAPPAPAPVVTGGLPPGAVTRVGGTSATQRDLSSITAQVPMVVNTGVTPAVRSAPARQRAPYRATVVLSVTIGVLLVALLVGIAGLVIHHYEPKWLNDLGITHSPTSAPHHGGATTGTTTPSTTATTAPALTCTSSSPNAASCSVAASSFAVTVDAVGGPSWVQITQSGQAAPTFSGVLPAGQSKVVLNVSSLSLDLGSAAAHVTVTTGLKVLGTYNPPSAPETVTISGTS